MGGFFKLILHVISGFGFGPALTLSNYINMLIVVKNKM